MFAHSKIATLCGVALMLSAAEVEAQPQRSPDRPMRPDVSLPIAEVEIPPLSEGQLRAEVRQRLGRDNFSFTGQAVRLTVRNPYDQRTGAGLQIDGARSVAAMFNTAMMSQGGSTGGMIMVRQPPGSHGFNIFDCEVVGPQSIEWRGRRDGSGTVSVSNNHAVFVVPATPDNWISFNAASSGGWNFHGCRLHAID